MDEKLEDPVETWTESQVSVWLKSIGVKEQNIRKIYEEEVDGRILLTLDENYLKTNIGLRSGPAHFIIQKRNELLNCPQPVENVCESTLKEDCRPRPFDRDDTAFTYVKHRVLQPESGAFDLISPCHEYKSFALAATLERVRLQTKFVREVFKFATACMNIRSNGTIHFGVMDSKEQGGYTHGEIVGIPVEEKDMYVDALDQIDKSFPADGDHARRCIRPPRFIEVIDRTSTVKKYVVEVDVVPSIEIVKGKVYAVRLPNFKESSNKVEREKKTIYQRMGANCEPVSEEAIGMFYEQVKYRDALREEAEQRQFFVAPGIYQDLGRKLKLLMTSGKRFIEKEKWFILVTNAFKQDDLTNIDWLVNMNVFCVFDFDPDSKKTGLCSKYMEHRAANLHFLQSYVKSSETSVGDFTTKLHLFEQTSWIFCNGRSDFKGNEVPCDEMMWIKEKKTLLKEAVSLICKEILPNGAFQVIFLLMSAVEKPLLHTFNEFYTDMRGHDDIICICDSEHNFEKWQHFAEDSCGAESVNNCSIVGMKMSHVNATLQQIQPVKACAKKHLPVFSKGNCLLETQEEEQMSSLEILAVDHCDQTNEDFIKEEKFKIEHQFYRGGRVSWMNFWLAEHRYVGEVIERDAYCEVSKLLSTNLTLNAEQSCVNSINIYHHPGSGGSTVARLTLWNSRKDLRCAVVKPSYSVSVVAQHAVKLREYEEKDPDSCLPVLLLIEDSNGEYLSDLRNELEVAMNSKRIRSRTACFILLSCRRSHDPEKKCKESPLQNVSVTHKLSDQEKRKFSAKRKVLEEQYQPEFILTFVLMSKEFDETYIREFVQHLLQDIDRNSKVTLLIHYVALLNTYVQNSFVSQSHCEALLAISLYMERFRHHNFERSLSDQARLVFIHLKDDKTHLESVRIIHPLVAQEILLQLMGNQQTQSSLAMDLLCDDVLFDHRFGQEEYRSFLRALFMRRSRVSRGDEYDSLFSPLIEHVRLKENFEQAITLLEKAYQRFQRDAFFAQQLARLYYTYEKFEDAKHWAELAAKQMPHNSYILDTRGQVYKKWLQAKCKALENVPKTAETTAVAVQTALKALECFEDCKKAALEDTETMNSSGFFAEVEVGCSLLKLIFSLEVFSNKSEGRSDCLRYLLDEHYIPDGVEHWEPFHGYLKKLQQRLQNALEWIAEDLSFFQTDIDADEEENPESPEEKIGRPLTWLAKKMAEYGRYFKNPHQSPGKLSPFFKRMTIYELGGGNITSILSKVTGHKEAVDLLENILALYPSDPHKANFPQRDMVNYIMTHIVLKCLSPNSSKVASLKTLQALSSQFPADKMRCSPGALFLCTLLFWPEEHDTVEEKERKYETVQIATDYLKKDYWAKMKDIPQRKRRIFTHFFLGNGSNLDKFVHKKKFESVTKVLSVSEKRMKWFSGEVWKMPEIAKVLRRVSGWTEDGVVHLEGPQKNKFVIHPLYVPSVPAGNENITFYIGFTFRGPVAYDIVVTK